MEKKAIPSLTWKINEERAEVRGTADGLEAMRQAVSKILQTERYRYAVYDWNYGIELEGLYGMRVSYVIPELKKRIEQSSNGKEIPLLGIKGIEVVAEAKEQQGVPAGAYITSIKWDSPAMTAGLQPGDRIVKIDGEAVTDPASVRRRARRRSLPGCSTCVSTPRRASRVVHTLSSLSLPVSLFLIVSTSPIKCNPKKLRVVSKRQLLLILYVKTG